ncbi:hypothetical protein [Erythrobacter donghaensis]|jgi:hypothetical protein|uniref:hypothetical protein n=1 Tax=Erythrobacter donghaensis TaxID=267135 RepID=UPI00093F7140|nr:hypothetical protein [Erythrobacter donghaensis]
MKFRIFLATAGALALTACNPGAQVEGARAQIDKFHALYDQGNAKRFYQETGVEFRKVVTEEQVQGLMTLFSKRLGKVESSKQTGFNTGFNNGTTTTTIVMQTRFERGEATETYIFTGSGKDMKLLNWNVTSPLLELSPEDIKKLTEDEGKAAR